MRSLVTTFYNTITEKDGGGFPPCFLSWEDVLFCSVGLRFNDSKISKPTP